MAYRVTMLPIEPGGSAVILDFDQAGDEFPVHVHDVNSNHMTFMQRGSILEIESGQVYRAPDVIDWPVGVPHGFRALEAGTRLSNIPKRRG